MNLGFYNKTQTDASINTGFYNKTQIQNTYAPLSGPSFTGTIISGGDLSLNSKLSVKNDVSMNGNLYVANNITTGTSSNIYDLNVNGTARINVANLSYNKLFVLYDGNTADAVSSAINFYGFGINTATLRYQVPTNANHYFYAAGTELLRINGTGTIFIPTTTGGIYGGNVALGGDLNVYGLNVGSGAFTAASSVTLNGANNNINGNITLSGSKTISGGSTTVNNGDLSVWGLNVGAGDITVTGGGIVSIGITTNTTFPLYVDSTTNNNVNIPSSGRLNPGTTATSANATSSSASVSIRATGVIWAEGNIFASSDIRIKKDINVINGTNALDKFRQIKPVEYCYIDKFESGLSKTYGFIAQYVKEIIPESISLHENYIPNIYDAATVIDNSLIVLDTKTTNEFTLSGDILKIKLYDYKEQQKIVTLDKIINTTSFTIKEPLLDSDLSDNKIFVYGQEVNDFHILSKETIFTVATAALQEVDRELEKTKTVVNDISMNMPIYKTRLEVAEQKIEEQSILILQQQEQISYLQEQINEINKKLNP